VAREFGVSVSTLYAYVDAQEQPQPRATKLLSKRARVSQLEPAHA